jgi:DNA-directed RNA polymerase specialized sigma24 family protein
MRVGGFRPDEIHDCYQAMSARVYAITVRRLPREDRQLCEDLVQETFWEACKHWAELRELTEVERAGWLTRAVTKGTTDALQRAESSTTPCPPLPAHNRA